MFNKILLSLLAISLFGCANIAIKSEFVKTRGYSEADMQDINEQSKAYFDILAKGHTNSNSFNTTEKVNAENRVKAVYCNCQKKLGAKCTSKPEGLSKDDRALWVKSNSAELALAGMSANGNPFDSKGYRLDPAECN